MEESRVPAGCRSCDRCALQAIGSPDTVRRQLASRRGDGAPGRAARRPGRRARVVPGQGDGHGRGRGQDREQRQDDDGAPPPGARRPTSLATRPRPGNGRRRGCRPRLGRGHRRGFLEFRCRRGRRGGTAGGRPRRIRRLGERARQRGGERMLEGAGRRRSLDHRRLRLRLRLQERPWTGGLGWWSRADRLLRPGVGAALRAARPLARISGRVGQGPVGQGPPQGRGQRMLHPPRRWLLDPAGGRLPRVGGDALGQRVRRPGLPRSRVARPAAPRAPRCLFILCHEPARPPRPIHPCPPAEHKRGEAFNQNLQSGRFCSLLVASGRPRPAVPAWPSARTAAPSH
jgi:hypothetical protein